MIDAVITYVDGSDKNWLEKYRSKVTKPIEETETRYRSYDCLDLQVRLIRKFMKFVDNIFIVVDCLSQVEKYSFTEEDNVTIVTHEEIIPKRYLPCFNSCAIEMFFYNIKDLKENFIYFNDDVFVVSECTEDDFFVNGKPCISFNEKNIELENNDSIFDHNIANSCNIIKEKFPVKRNRKKYVRPSHSIIPLKKSAYTYIWTKCFNDIDKSLTRTRHRRNYNVYLFTNYEYYVRSYVNKKLPMKFYTVIAETQNIYDDIKNDGLKSICMNDIYIYDFNEWKVEFLKMLSCLLNDNQYVAPIKEKQKIIIDDTLIVSFTSWTKRIQYCKHTVDLMMKQTLLPNKIILNLAEEEFPNKMNDLPDDLVKEAINNNIFEIYWVKENTTVWKKIIPTMNRFPNDLVFSIDDDIEYPSNYIEEMYKTYCENNEQCPVVAYEFIIDGNLCHSGPFTLTSKRFYGDLLNDIYNDVILSTLPEKKWQSDIAYYKVVNTLGYKYVKCKKINGNLIYKKSRINKENSYSVWDKQYKNEREENIKLIDNYLSKTKDILFKKKVIYTCITGNYDNLLEPKYISPGFDYICFTDNKNLKSNIWKILPIPDNLLYLSKVKQQRNIKINAHKYLSNYDLSIWVDSSVKLSDNMNKLLCTLDFINYNIFITKHPQRNCVYKEGEACIKLKKDIAENINKELDFFRNSGMPENYGLVETNVMIRLHNEYSCIALMGEWWYYLNMYSHRDQLSLPYCLWKLNYKKLCVMPVGFNHTLYCNWIGGLHKKVNICIIHYNTPELTDALIKSINKYVKRAFIYLFDNSTTKPFTNRYDNMLYLDNTNGQYIDFDKWLERYPTRLQSKEHIGNYGSARHSISVQKCIEIIDDNFILMDSDILLKRDISGFINNKCIYVGQSEKQGNGKYRVLPFCLFINVNMCKKYNVPWFDENYMHGLHITKEADKYDTGGAFYVHTRDLPFKEVDLNSFIVHYKGGSWDEKYMKIHNLTLTSKEWLEINKKYWKD